MSNGSPAPSLLLRLPPELRERVTELAQEQGVCLNTFITRALQECVERIDTEKSNP